MTTAGVEQPPMFHKRRWCEGQNCGVRFGLWGRHHCRRCGSSVCAAHFSRPLCTGCVALQAEVRVPTGPATCPQRGDEDEDPNKVPPPRGCQDVELSKDVYATAFVLANNATPALYSFSPLFNRDMLLVWLYLFFIVCSQAFVLYSLVFIHPPAVDSSSIYVDCSRPSDVARAFLDDVTDIPMGVSIAHGARDTLHSNLGATEASTEEAAPGNERPLGSHGQHECSRLFAYGNQSVLAVAACEVAQDVSMGHVAQAPAAAPSRSDNTLGSWPSNPGPDHAAQATTTDDTNADSTVTGLSPAAMARCLAANVAFQIHVDGRPIQYRVLERQVFFYQNVLGSGSPGVLFLQLVCCIWVTVQVYFVDCRNVEALLAYRDFNRWLLPLKQEEPRRNNWVLVIPLLQYCIGVCIVTVSCCVICGYDKAFDIVLNSLAFTFISQVSEIFNEPLLRYYSSKSIDGLHESYGPDPIYYLYPEYSEHNSDPSGEWANSWYIKEDEQHAGLLHDFKFRHTPDDYPRPNSCLIELLRIAFFCVPVLTTVGCWAITR